MTEVGEYEFYCRTHEHRIAEIARIGEEKVSLDIRRLMDDISDGCGGCERAMFTNAAGNEAWISVVSDQGSRVWYCYIEIRQYFGEDNVVSATYGSICPRNGQTQDDFELYLEFFRMVESDKEEE